MVKSSTNPAVSSSSAMVSRLSSDLSGSECRMEANCVVMTRFLQSKCVAFGKECVLTYSVEVWVDASYKSCIRNGRNGFSKPFSAISLVCSKQ